MVLAFAGALAAFGLSGPAGSPGTTGPSPNRPFRFRLPVSGSTSPSPAGPESSAPVLAYYYMWVQRRQLDSHENGPARTRRL